MLQAHLPELFALRSLWAVTNAYTATQHMFFSSDVAIRFYIMILDTCSYAFVILNLITLDSITFVACIAMHFNESRNYLFDTLGFGTFTNYKNQYKLILPKSLPA